MSKCGRPKAPLTLTDDELQKLKTWASRPKSTQRLATRAKIVLACAEGLDNKDVAARLHVNAVTVGANGNVAMTNLGANPVPAGTTVSLDGISFRCAPSGAPARPATQAVPRAARSASGARSRRSPRTRRSVRT